MEQAQYASMAMCQLCTFFCGGTELALDGPNPLAIELAGSRQRDAARIPLEQRKAKFIFQLGDLAAQCRLGDEELACRSR